MIGEGMKVQFIPATLPSGILTPAEKKKAMVVGTVDYINYQHKYFSVAYKCGKTKQHESFKFCDIGKTVTIIG